MENQKEKYNIMPIYSAAAVWLIYGVAIGFGSVIGYIWCTFISAFTFFLIHLIFPPMRAQPEQSEGIEAVTDNTDQETTWDGLSHLVTAQYVVLKDKPIAPYIKTIKESVDQIGKAIENDPERSKISYIRRFISLYSQYSYDLKDYESCCSISEPGRSVRELLHSTEEKWKRIADVSILLQDEVYSDRSLSIKADAEVISRIFAPIENQQLGITEGEGEDEVVHN